MDLYLTDRKAWREWLSNNHNKETEIWLIHYKKESGKSRIPYSETVEEALCFGWIDSIVKKIDEDRFKQKFTPRKDKSHWSKSNKLRIEKLIKNGQITPAGLAKVKIAKANGCWEKKTARDQEYEFPPELETMLEKNERAQKFFQGLSFADQKQYVCWIAFAKRETTRIKRATEAVEMLAQFKKLGLK